MSECIGSKDVIVAGEERAQQLSILNAVHAAAGSRASGIPPSVGVKVRTSAGEKKTKGNETIGNLEKSGKKVAVGRSRDDIGVTPLGKSFGLTVGQSKSGNESRKDLRKSPGQMAAMSRVRVHIERFRSVSTDKQLREAKTKQDEAAIRRFNRRSKQTLSPAVKKNKGNTIGNAKSGQKALAGGRSRGDSKEKTSEASAHQERKAEAETKAFTRLALKLVRDEHCCGEGNCCEKFLDYVDTSLPNAVGSPANSGVRQMQEGDDYDADFHQGDEVAGWSDNDVELASVGDGDDDSMGSGVGRVDGAGAKRCDEEGAADLGNGAELASVAGSSDSDDDSVGSGGDRERVGDAGVNRGAEQQVVGEGDENAEVNGDLEGVVTKPVWVDGPSTFELSPGGTQIECKVCEMAGGEYVTQRMSSFQDHLRLKHPGVSEPSFSTCLGCGRFFQGVPGLSRHIASVKRGKDKHPLRYAQCVEKVSPPPRQQRGEGAAPAPRVGIPAGGQQENGDEAEGVEAACDRIGIEKLAAFHRDKMVFVHKSWGASFLTVVTAVLDQIGNGAEESGRDAAMLALTILPGLIININRRDKKLRVKDFLETTAKLSDQGITVGVVKAACDLYDRFAGAEDSTQNGKRVQSGRVTAATLGKQAQKMLREGRIGAAGHCLSQIDKLQTEGVGANGYVDPAMCLSMDERRKIISDLHPPARSPESGFDEPADRAMEDEPPGLKVTAEQALHYAKTMSKGTAPGADGWVDHVIRWLVSEAESRGGGDLNIALSKLGDALASFANAAYSGAMSKKSAKLFNRVRSVIASKDVTVGGFRPMGLKGTFARWVGRMAANLTGRAVAKHLMPVQLAVGMSDGCGVGVRTAQAWLDKPPINGAWQHSRAVVSLDVKNAFNSLDRGEIRSGVRKYAPEMVRFFRLCYDDPLPLYHSSGEQVGEAAIGVLQGDPMSGIYSGIAFKEPYTKMQAALLEEEKALDEREEAHVDNIAEAQGGDIEQHEEPAQEAFTLGFADDGNLCARLGALVHMMPRAQVILADHGLEGAMHKFVLAGPEVHRLPPEERAQIESGGVRKLSSDGLKMFGCFVGNEKWVKERVAEKIDSHTPQDPTILRILGDTRGGLAVLSMHYNSKTQFISRHQEPHITKEALVKHNERIDGMLGALIGDDPNRPLFRELRSLPRKLGGLGIGAYGGIQTASGVMVSRAKSLAYAKEYVPSVMVAMKQSQDIYPVYLGDAEGISTEEESGIELSDEQEEGRQSDDGPAVAAVYRISISPAVHALVERRVRDTLAQMEEEGERTKPKLAYFISAQDPNAGKFIGCAHGIGHPDAISNEAYKAALRVRMLAPPRDKAGRVATQCYGCNKRVLVDREGISRPVFEHNWAHFAACINGTTGPFSSRHKGIVELVATLVESAAKARGTAVVLQREKSSLLPFAPGQVEGLPEGPYLPGYSPRMDLHVQWESGKQRFIDVAVADPGCSSYLAAGSSARAEAAAEAREKDKRCSFKKDFRGVPEDEFVPFVLEATGRVGPAAMKFLYSIGASNDMLRRFFERVSLMCAKNLGRLALHSQGVSS